MLSLRLLLLLLLLCSELMPDDGVPGRVAGLGDGKGSDAELSLASTDLSPSAADDGLVISAVAAFGKTGMMLGT